MRIEDELKSKFRNDYHKALLNLVFTQKHVFSEFLQILKRNGLSEPAYNILRIIRGAEKYDAVVSIGYLKERMLDKNSDVSRLVDRLVKNGLIYRKECPNDRRLKEISLAKKGTELLTKLDAEEQTFDNLMSNLSSTEIKELNRLLDKIRN